MTDPITRLNSALSGRYRIESEIGAGGMAAVYLAQDLKHDRKVALKVLKPELAAVLGADRFVQEIKTTANLQHPHILPLFDSGEADGFLYYVMPFIDGETLREKLDRETQLGIEEAVKITADVADALDYAHRQNVIHRDIKPENILLHDGRPMVADFGIALAVSAAAGGRMTETGLSLGTPHYMSPEQATAEKNVTHRSDLYSLGCVLYEMLAGDPPHTGSSAQAIIMKIVTDEARPVTELRKSVPPNVAAAVARALEKLPADRLESASGFAAALEDSSFRDEIIDSGGVGLAGRPRRLSYALGGLMAFAGLSAGLAVGFWIRRPLERPVSEFAIPLTGEHEISNAQGVNMALSPDGRLVVFRGQTQLWRRSLDDLEIVPIPGTDEGRNPIISPDGQSVAFVSLERLRIVSLEGGPPRTLVDGGVAGGFGGIDWATDGTLYFVDQRGAIHQVPVAGGVPEQLTTPEPGTAHAWVDALPDGRGLLFTIAPGTDPTLSEIAVYSHEDAGIHPLGLKGAMARYDESGYLVYAAADDRLMTVGFDLGRMEIVRQPLSTGTEVRVYNGSASQFALSVTGTLLYEPPQEITEAVPVWVTRAGIEAEIDSHFRVRSHSGVDLSGISLSPDGSRMVISDLRSGYSRQLLTKDLNESPPVPFASDVGESWTDFGPIWLEDGFVTFLSNRNGRGSVWRQRADGLGDPELVVQRERSIYMAEPSPDGAWVAFREDGEYNREILAVRISESDQVVRLAEVGSRGGGLNMSPDGRWIAYVSDLSGRLQVMVRRFPDAESPQWPVSTTGGTEPLWSRDGEELFFRNANDEMVAISVSGDSIPVFGLQRVLFSAAGYLSGFNRTYDVAPDGRFVMLRAAPADRVNQLVVVLNFSERLKQRSTSPAG